MQSTARIADIDVSLAVADEPNEYDEDDANDENGDKRVQASFFSFRRMGNTRSSSRLGKTIVQPMNPKP